MTTRTLTELPTPLHALAARAPGSPARQVEIAQQGEMWMKPGGPSRPFTAVQRVALDRVAFSWRARFPLFGPLAVRVVDGYAKDEGTLTVSLVGVPLQRQTGVETTRGEALRYLAELAFFSPALLCNPELELRKLDGRHVEVATTVHGQRLTVTLEVDQDGHVIRASSAMRELKRNDGWRVTPWSGEFRNYAQVGPLYLPTAAEAYWELETGRYVYWRGAITGASLIEEPFSP